jgi:hypothetical protein
LLKHWYIQLPFGFKGLELQHSETMNAATYLCDDITLVNFDQYKSLKFEGGIFTLRSGVLASKNCKKAPIIFAILSVWLSDAIIWELRNRFSRNSILESFAKAC